MRTVVVGGRDTHDGHENSPILVFFSNLLGLVVTRHDRATMELTRRSFLTACLAVAGSPGVDGLPAAGWDDLRPPEEFPWTEISRALRSQYPDLRRHFAFEYYPWYATDPYRHWQQWGREPPTDLAASSLPLLGGYDSRSAAVVEQHARWMVECGIGVVDLSWWGPGSFSDRAVSLVMDVMHAHDIQVTFHLEPYGRARVDRFASDIQYLLTEYGEKRGWDAFFLHQRADGTREARCSSCSAPRCPSRSRTVTG